MEALEADGEDEDDDKDDEDADGDDEETGVDRPVVQEFIEEEREPRLAALTQCSGTGTAAVRVTLTLEEGAFCWC